MTNPKVSVIVTTFNRKDFLKETIEAILNQTYQDFELIVVDNFSEYDFIEFIKTFNSTKILPFQNQNNGIIAVNRNYGIKQASGEYIAFCDDDDIWLPEKINTQVSIIQSTSADLVYSNTFHYFESGEIKLSNYSLKNSFNKLIFNNHLTLSSVLVRNSNFLFFNEDETYMGIEDYELWINLLLSGFIFEFSKAPLLKYRIINSSFSRILKSRIEFSKNKLKLTILTQKKSLSFFSKLLTFISLAKGISKFLILRFLGK